mgnify:CR=1 FL=1
MGPVSFGGSMKNDKLKHLLENKNDVSQLRLSRRDLLEAGLLSFATRISVPGAVTSILTLGEKAVAADAPMMPFVTLSLSGGAALHGNFVVKNSGGDLLSAYTKLGLGKPGFSTTKVMGADWASTAQFHKGIMSVASPEALSRSNLVALCTDTANDTNALAAARPFYDLSGPLERAGLVGSTLPGVHFGSASENLRTVFSAPNSTLNVSTLSDIFAALNYSSVFADNGLLSKKQKGALGKFVSRMTASQAEKLNGSTDSVKTALKEAGIKSGAIIEAGGATGIDPRQDANVQAVYKLTTSTAVNTQDAMTSAVVYNALKGNISHGRITMGGYDYHSPGLREVADSKDFTAGAHLGKMLELAHRMKKPLFVLITTDGACVAEISDSATSIWASDYSSSLQFIIAYDPNGKIKSSGNQIGHYLADQSVDNTLSLIHI